MHTASRAVEAYTESGLETGREAPSSFSVPPLPLLTRLSSVRAGKGETRPDFIIVDQEMRDEFGHERS